MQIGQLSRDVRLLSTGFNRASGGTIAQNEVPPDVWADWVTQGIVVLPVMADIDRHAKMKIKRRRRAVPP